MLTNHWHVLGRRLVTFLRASLNRANALQWVTCRRGWLVVRLGLAGALLLALGASVSSVPPAQANPVAAPPKQLHLATLVMYTPEDNMEDEPYLVINGRKVWRGTISKPNLCGGGCPISVGLYHLAPIPFYDNIEVVLKEEDGPFDRDDFLGRHFISADEAEGELHDLWFTEDGARYKLSYAISTAPASFVCDGDPGVYLYEHADYRGRCTKFTQNSLNIGWSGVGNDSATSIRIVGCYAAILYEHQDYGGASSAFASNDANLGDDDIGNDRVTSMVVFSSCG